MFFFFFFIVLFSSFFFFFNDTATTEIYTLSLHDALPIYGAGWEFQAFRHRRTFGPYAIDRKSTRLNSSHQIISYAVFCLKKKKNYTAAMKTQKTKKKNKNKPEQDTIQ